MDHLTDAQLRPHLRNIILELQSSDDRCDEMLLRLPSDTLRIVLTEVDDCAEWNMTPADNLEDAIRNRLKRLEGCTPCPTWPYCGFHEHMELLGELPGGRKTALSLSIEHGLTAFKMFYDYNLHDDNFVEDMILKYDQVALRLASAEFVAQVEDENIWAPDQLIAAIENVRQPILRRSRTRNPSAMLERKRAKTSLYPQTTRYLRAVHSRAVALSIVPKIAGLAIPAELVSLICEAFYNKHFMDSAPAANRSSK